MIHWDTFRSKEIIIIIIHWEFDKESLAELVHL